MPTHQQQLQQLAGPPATHYNQQPHQQQQHQPYQFNLMPASMTAPLGNMKAHYYSSSTTNNGYTAATTGANPTASVSAPTYYGQTHTASSYPYQPQQPQQPYPYQQQHQPQSAISHPSTTQMIIPSVPMYDTNIAPFAGVLSKANLKIIGDLMEMTYGWNEREWANGRRLVQFWRRQHVGNGEGSRNINDSASSSNDNEVECGFKAIDQEEYQQQRIRENMASKYTATTTTTPNTINGHTASNSTNGSGSMMSSTSMKKANPLIISCIYWREHNDFYITSVDCIFLLEGLIGVEFTVEEKNRIRRNLEGFRPLTVSKCKPECSEFFKLIMGFPHPKPRNIEKDVKVFAWKTLPSALKKIIRKYTPSYSSTAVVNINAASGNNAL
ncbi:hypothetical protein BDF20DRAFT_895940 [Mycotypha africana]|uniref:uncharacterized protein n=1 Tax=Mycotypha africana TaxID=64632 RepID=UPI0023001EB5|nr:uncharacterized protein BDF20DRAFT_895940 [Mycotypha africana]KAI8968363.1 hypothetical protein BDF20DRAFT_895940 [Mycotypha africana]